jgi:hypothetical protein
MILVGNPSRRADATTAARRCGAINYGAQSKVLFSLGMPEQSFPPGGDA